MKKEEKDPMDWRSRPNKPEEKQRTKRLSIRLSLEELEEMHSRAWDAGLTLADYVRAKCLGKRAR